MKKLADLQANEILHYVLCSAKTGEYQSDRTPVQVRIRPIGNYSQTSQQR
jgi:hypothetical protein